MFFGLVSAFLAYHLNFPSPLAEDAGVAKRRASVHPRAGPAASTVSSPPEQLTACSKRRRARPVQAAVAAGRPPMIG